MTFSLCKKVSICLIAAVLFFTGTAVAAAGVILGDADSDTEVTVLDVTNIQRSLAELPVSGTFSAQAANVDGINGVEIADVTIIQRWLAEMDTPYPIGTQVETPTEAPTQFPTDAEGWGKIIYRP